jgi:hypothetical protein
MKNQKNFEKQIREDLQNTLWEIFNKYKVLTISTNWRVLDKTYGEVGGRFLEDFLLSELNNHITQTDEFNIIKAYAPDGRRTMEDIIVEWQAQGTKTQKLLLSLKGHKSGSSSNPNLCSLQKTKLFYENHPADTHFILVVLHYIPERIVDDGFHMSIEGVDVCHLKDLEDKHFSLQTIGSGGQFLLANINNIKDKYRTYKDFLKLVYKKEFVWLEKRKTKR